VSLWWRRTRIPLAAEAALAVVASLAFFGLVSAVLTVTTEPIPVLVLAVFCSVVVVRTAHAGADLYAVPLALAAVLAFDFFYLPPLRTFGFPDYANWGALALYLVITVLVCTISARTRRRVESLNRAQAALATEQAALRRVATLVAQEPSASEVLAAVAEEVGRLMAIEGTRVLRYEPDGTATVIAGWNVELLLPIGERVSLEGQNITAKVFDAQLPVRMDSYLDATGPVAATLRNAGVRSSIGCPIIVGGRLWGAMVAVTSQPEPMPVGAEFRLAEFTELVATAISNAQARAELAASRARLVGAADQTRQRIERDLHDGIQQRLVSLSLDLHGAEAILPGGFDDVHAELSRVGEGLVDILGELREISRGIHPAILSEGGLKPALKALARRSPVPVELDVRTDRRLPERVEVAAYYCVSEALTNAAKHGQASVVHIKVEPTDGLVRLSIRDDGVGGADPGRGSGLIGLEDRVEAVGGKLEITSPPGSGTSLLVTLPVDASHDIAVVDSPG
jgi:signal transduction histidine kinase